MGNSDGLARLLVIPLTCSPSTGAILSSSTYRRSSCAGTMSAVVFFHRFCVLCRQCADCSEAEDSYGGRRNQRR